MANKGVGQNDIAPMPFLQISRTKDRIILDFDMGKQESIFIFCKRAKETDFVFLTETDESPYIDTRPNLTEYSETREYKAIFAVDGEPIGEPDQVKIRTKGRFRFF